MNNKIKNFKAQKAKLKFERTRGFFFSPPVEQ